MSFAEQKRILASHPDYAPLHESLGVVIDLKYAGTDNFLAELIYRDFDQAFLHVVAYEKLLCAIELLRQRASGHRFKVFDCTRPSAAQRHMWDRLDGEPLQQQYLANPAKGSIHCYGFAVDLTVIDEHGREFDMGTAYDAFTPLSEPRREKAFHAEGALTTDHLENRAFLREIMLTAGFTQLPIEWWHFDALPPDEVRSKYKPVV